MQKRIRNLQRLTAVAGLIALTGMIAVPVYAQSGGSITFTGAIVAPSFEVLAAPSRTAIETADVANGMDSGDNGVTVSFITPPGGSPAANVALLPANPAQQGDRAISQAVSASVFDHTGKQVKPDANGVFQLDQHGAIMDLAPVKSASGATGRGPFVVLVSYN
jgi:hypothetical protein